jgi:hypothetical protein
MSVALSAPVWWMVSTALKPDPATRTRRFCGTGWNPLELGWSCQPTMPSAMQIRTRATTSATWSSSK